MVWLAPLKFQAPLPFVIAGAAVVLVTVVLSVWAWRRAEYARGVGGVELLRIGIVALIVAVLAQPEWVEITPPPEHPMITVFVDRSASMETEDVTADPDDPSAPPIARQAWTDQLVNNESFWRELKQEYEVVFEPFASAVGTEDRNGSNYAAALRSILEKDTAVRGAVLIGDGDWNAGAPPIEVASRLAMRKIPVVTVATGRDTPLPDLQVRDLNVPVVTVEQRTLRIPFAIESTIGRDIRTTARLKVTDGEVATLTVQIPAMGRFEGAFTWTPAAAGDFKVTVSIPDVRDEVSVDNNSVTMPIKVQQEAIQVLLIEAGSRWEYRYLRNAFERDPGVDVKALLFHPGLEKMGGGRGYLKAFPSRREALAKFDVVFVGDVGVEQLTPDDCRLLKGLVEQQAVGLVFMPGLSGRQHSLLQTELADLLPIEFDESKPRGEGTARPQPYALTDVGRSSLLTKLTDDEEANLEIWERLPGFTWHAGVLRAKPGSDVLVVHGNESNAYGRVPLIVTRPYGHGKVLFMATDGAWKWRRGVEDRYHYRFWSQVARWMAYQRNMARGESMRLFFSPDHPREGTRLVFHANVMDAGGEPLESGNVVLQVSDPSGKTKTLRMAPEPGGWGLFSAEYDARLPGEHRLKLTCRENNSVIESTLYIQPTEGERPGRPARPDILAQIAAVTGGRMVTPAAVSEIRKFITELPELEPITTRMRIWSHPVTMIVVVALFAMFWIGRKAVGQI